MKEPISTYKTCEIVVVPFPFTDQKKSKNRPALVLSSEVFNARNGKSVLAMITSRAGKELWSNDLPISNLKPTGLLEESLVRFKIFTLDHIFIKARIGFLSGDDVKALKSTLREMLGL